MEESHAGEVDGNVGPVILTTFDLLLISNMDSYHYNSHGLQVYLILFHSKVCILYVFTLHYYFSHLCLVLLCFY